jgi:hypothetical protein
MIFFSLSNEVVTRCIRSLYQTEVYIPRNL